MSNMTADGVVIALFNAMLSDFRSTNDHFRTNVPFLNIQNISEVRKKLANFEPGMSLDIYRFKCHAQLLGFLKRWTFRDHDQFTAKQRERLTMDKYLETQERLAKHCEYPLRARLVIQHARKIARDILGNYAVDEHVRSSHFGRKASIGCPLQKAYLDYKFKKAKAYTGSEVVSRWFYKYVLPGDDILSQALHVVGKNPVRIDALRLNQVAKSYKINRIITPLPLLDLFYSNGLGKMIAERLSLKGLDIARLQQRHRWLVKMESKKKRLATADLSSASDSLTSRLLNAVLPREWYTVLKPLFMRNVVFKGTTIYTESVLPMGNGATFPVETLVFYSLLCAIRELSHSHGLISVYGDDLIYPAKMHGYVLNVFQDIGLIMNQDKTFVNLPFRESCGADYYKGWDVRPYAPETERTRTRTQMLGFLYKLWNGLREHWEYAELPSVYYYLAKEISCRSSGKGVFRVPSYYPDYSGIKTSRCDLHYDGIPPWVMNWFSPQRQDCFHYNMPQNNNAKRTLFCLRQTRRHRFIIKQLPYYWLKLSSGSDELLEYNEIPQVGLDMLTFIPVTRVKEDCKKPDGKPFKFIEFLPAVPRKGATDLVEAPISTSVGTEEDWFF